MTQTDRDTPVTALLEAVRDYVEWFDSPRRSYRRDGTHGRILAKFRAALASSDDVAGSGERLDVERLMHAIRNIERRNDRLFNYLRDTDALAIEYARLAAPTTEAPPKDAPTFRGGLGGVGYANEERRHE